MSVRDSVVYLGTRGLGGVLSLVTVLAFARGLGPSGYGWLTLCVSGAGVIGSIIVVPVCQTLARYAAGIGMAGLPALLAKILLSLSVTVLVLAALFEHVLPDLVPPGVLVGAAALSLCIGVFELSAQYANSRILPGRYASLFLGKAMLTLVVGGLVIHLGGGASAVLIAMMTAGLVASVVVLWPAWREEFRVKAEATNLLTVRRFALMLACISGCSGLLQWFDRWVVGALVGVSAAGAYGAVADLLSQTIMMVASALFLAWYPHMVSAWEEKRVGDLHLLGGKYLSLCLAVMLPVGAGFVVLGPAVLKFLLGGAYSDETLQFVPWMVASACFASLRTMVFDVALFVSGRLGRQLCNALAAAVVGGLFMFLLVPSYGSLGAAVATMCAQALGIALSWHAGKGLIEWRVRGRDLTSLMIATGGMVLVMWGVPGEGLMELGGRAVLGLLVFGASMLAMNGLSLRSFLMSHFR